MRVCGISRYRPFGAAVAEAGTPVAGSAAGSSTHSGRDDNVHIALRVENGLALAAEPSGLQSDGDRYAGFGHRRQRRDLQYSRWLFPAPAAFSRAGAAGGTGRDRAEVESPIRCDL